MVYSSVVYSVVSMDLWCLFLYVALCLWICGVCFCMWLSVCGSVVSVFVCGSLFVAVVSVFVCGSLFVAVVSTVSGVSFSIVSGVC